MDRERRSRPGMKIRAFKAKGNNRSTDFCIPIPRVYHHGQGCRKIPLLRKRHCHVKYEQLQLILKEDAPTGLSHFKGEHLEIKGRHYPIEFRRNRRARNYLLYIRPGGRITVTIPNFGSKKEAWSFVKSRTPWITKHLSSLEKSENRLEDWQVGKNLLFRGTPTLLEKTFSEGQWMLRLDSIECPVPYPEGDMRPYLEKALFEQSKSELPERTLEIAEQQNLVSRITRISIRSQKTRWGSCSHKGTISLNWRLIQTPPEVSDYILIHELMHLLEMNHSKRFWKKVQNACPDYKNHELWIRKFGRKILGDY